MSLWTSSSEQSCNLDCRLVVCPPVTRGQRKKGARACVEIHTSATEGVRWQCDTLHGPFHDRLVTCMAWLTDQVLATAGESNSIQVFRQTKDQLQHISTNTMHSAGIRSLSVMGNKDRSILITTGGKQMICMWQWVSDRLEHLHTYIDQNASQDQRIAASVVLPYRTENVVLCGDSEGYLRLVRASIKDGLTLVHQRRFRAKPVLCMCQVAGGGTSATSLVATGYSDGFVDVYQINVDQDDDLQVELHHSYHAHALGVNCLVSHGGHIVSGGDDQALCVYNQGTLERYPEALGSAIKAVHMSSTTITAIGYDQRLTFWSWPSMKWLGGVQTPVGDVAALAVNGVHVAVAGHGLEILQRKEIM